MPRMTHPELPGQPIQVENESRIPVLEKSGWVVDDEDSDEDDDPDPAPGPGPAFVEGADGAPDPDLTTGVVDFNTPADAGLL